MLSSTVIAADRGSAPASRMLEDLLLDGVLFLVRQFEAAVAEHLEPLSWYGLCDAEIITPARKGPVRVR